MEKQEKLSTDMRMLELLERADVEEKFAWMREFFQHDGENMLAVTESANAIGVKISKDFYDECVSELDLLEVDDREIKEHLDEMLVA